MGQEKKRDQKLREVETKCNALAKLAVGRAAMNTMLVGLLIRKNILSQDEAKLLTAASRSALEIPGMTVEKINKWAEDQIADMGLPGRMDSGPLQGS